MGTVIGKEREIERLYRKKYSVSSIARKLDVATTAISQKLERMGLRERIHPARLSDGEKAAIVSEYAAGATSGFLAKKYDVHKVTIRDVVRKGGGQLVNRGNRFREFTEDEQVVMRTMWKNEEAVQTIANRLKAPAPVIRSAMLRMGIPVNPRIARGSRHGRWKGGRHVTSEGYVWVKLEDDSPYASMRLNTGYIQEHRLVMAKSLGRPLTRKEQVHHINEDKSDNRPENLQLRQKNHGVGGAYRCLDCGSHNVEPVEL